MGIYSKYYKKLKNKTIKLIFTLDCTLQQVTIVISNTKIKQTVTKKKTLKKLKPTASSSLYFLRHVPTKTGRGLYNRLAKANTAKKCHKKHIMVTLVYDRWYSTNQAALHVLTQKILFQPCTNETQAPPLDHSTFK